MMEKPNLQLLEAKIDALIAQCLQLAEENQVLRHQQKTLLAERAALIKKNSLARTRIEAMIARLKAIEIDPSHE